MWQITRSFVKHYCYLKSGSSILKKISPKALTYTLAFFVCAAGMIDCPGNQDGSSLRSLIDKPPVCGNSFSPLTGALLTGFRLHTGPVQTLHNMHQICIFIYFTAVTVDSSPSFYMFRFCFSSFCFAATRTVQTDAHTASKEEKQTQAQTPPTAGPTASRYRREHPSWVVSQLLNWAKYLSVLTSQKHHQTLIQKRRRKSETMIRTARKRRKTRKRRK